VAWYQWRFRGKRYEGIDDMPIARWWAIHENRDYTHLLHRRRGHYNRFQKAALFVAWEKIFESYIERFGFSDEFRAIIEKRSEIAQLTNEKIQSGDRSIQTIIEIAGKELRDLEQRVSGKMDFYEYMASIERILGRNLDPERCTVVKFFSIVNDLKKRTAPPQPKKH
jgi:hypothetical protein